MISGVPLHLALFPRLWLDVHAATHIDRKHIAALLCSSYTVDYVDAVLLDERSSLGVPAIHAFLKTFFPKLASHVLTEQTCSLIDNLVSSLTAMVEAVDVQVAAHRLTGDLRALALVYSSGTRLKPPSGLQPALDTLLARTRAAKTKESSQKDTEAPSKKRKFSSSEEEEQDEKTVLLLVDVDTKEQKTDFVVDDDNKIVTNHQDDIIKGDDDSKDDDIDNNKDNNKLDDNTTAVNNKSKTTISTNVSNNLSSSPAVSGTTTTSCATSQLRCSLTNVSWLEMLEKTIVDLQMIVQLQIKNN